MRNVIVKLFGGQQNSNKKSEATCFGFQFNIGYDKCTLSNA